MSDHLYIGLDAGTSLTKAAIFDLAGNQLAEAQHRTTVLRPHPGWSELDPAEAWKAALDVLGRVVRESGVDASRIRGIGLTAAMVGAWLVDADGQAVRQRHHVGGQPRAAADRRACRPRPAVHEPHLRIVRLGDAAGLHAAAACMACPPRTGRRWRARAMCLATRIFCAFA
ncbi:MAG: hypothetical protein KL840_12155 [Aquamicrobium sp.]|nr:hypothetical protein [Aquamicrobium sp.]